MYIFVHSPDVHKRRNETLNFLTTDNNHLSLTLKIITHPRESDYTVSKKKFYDYSKCALSPRPHDFNGQKGPLKGSLVAV